MRVAGHSIEIINPNDITLGLLRRTNRFLSSLHNQGDIDGDDLDSLDKIDKAIAVVMLSLACQVEGCGIDIVTWQMAESVTVADLSAMADDASSDIEPEPSGRVVELTGALAADVSAVVLSPTSADS